MIKLARVLGGVLLVSSAVANAGEPAPFHWPDGHKAAVSLSYDDALDSQLDIAIPQLDQYGFKGSFYLQLSREPVAKRMEAWRAAARNGHELGNHTLFHQCSGSVKGHEWVEPARDLDHTSAAQMKDQVLLANTMLQALDGQTQRTMTVPCGDVMAQGENYIKLVAPQFVAIKLGDGAVVPDMATLDLHAVPVEAPVGVTGAQLIARVEEAGRRGTMVNFTFHGVGGDYLTVSREAHEALLRYLAAHRDVYWVDTFLTLTTYVQAQRAPAR
ncbi:polysaccharide deacetylase [Stenotrophomonas panacihumi]|uniref:Polysaccharide deacetylase n=1 Tax=Stenotrophomonas panacihumi TaxID=676599 RepID=A0A0R0AP32_9GAMM|nr:polysaccharide deacetylase family protein [Stenotrophomonas panacihumi]KRG44178.1 polysaccharide deacetylase [Stenotrophomonas panacihumi]PTN56263.1 polysaccharide deacetylase [Stenotrophomonas panacihumi]